MTVPIGLQMRVLFQNHYLSLFTKSLNILSLFNPQAKHTRRTLRDGPLCCRRSARLAFGQLFLDFYQLGTLSTGLEAEPPNQAGSGWLGLIIGSGPAK